MLHLFVEVAVAETNYKYDSRRMIPIPKKICFEQPGCLLTSFVLAVDSWSKQLII